MIRKLKIAGVLIAVAAMPAVTASSASATFTSAKYPATASASTTKDSIDLFGSMSTCTENTFAVEKVGGGAIAAASPSVTVKPTYKSCTVFGFPGTVNMTSCDYVLTSPAAPNASKLLFDIECNTGDAIDVTAYSSTAHTTALCHVRIGPQGGKAGATATNVAGTVVVTGSIGALAATQMRTNMLCPLGENTAAGTYTFQAGGMVLVGNNGNFSVD